MFTVHNNNLCKLTSRVDLNDEIVPFIKICHSFGVDMYD